MLICARHRSVTASAGGPRTDSPPAAAVAAAAAAVAAAYRRPAQQSGAIASQTGYNKTLHFQTTRRRRQLHFNHSCHGPTFRLALQFLSLLVSEKASAGKSGKNRRVEGELATGQLADGFTVAALSRCASAAASQSRTAPHAVLTVNVQRVNVLLHSLV